MKIPESARRKSPAECAAEFEEEVEANSSMDSEDDRKGVFSQILPKQYRPLRAYNFKKSAGCESFFSFLFASQFFFTSE